MLCLPWDSFLVSNDRPKIEQVFESRQDGAVEKPRLWRKILHAAIGIPGRLALFRAGSPLKRTGVGGTTPLPLLLYVAEIDPRAIANPLLKEDAP